MSKKLIRLTESDLHRIVKESIGKILKEGYYEDLYLDDNDDSELKCPYCESDNVQEIMGKNGSWDGSCKCYDCGKVFDIDSARGNNYFEPDWGAMRHESHKRNGKILKEMDLTPKWIGSRHASKSHIPCRINPNRNPMNTQTNMEEHEEELGSTTA